MQQGMHMKVFSKVYCDRVYFLCAERFVTGSGLNPQRHPPTHLKVECPPPPPGVFRCMEALGARHFITFVPVYDCRRGLTNVGPRLLVKVLALVVAEWGPLGQVTLLCPVHKEDLQPFFPCMLVKTTGPGCCCMGALRARDSYVLVLSLKGT